MSILGSVQACTVHSHSDRQAHGGGENRQEGSADDIHSPGDSLTGSLPITAFPLKIVALLFILLMYALAIMLLQEEAG